jgi:hypothetical protein
MDKAALVVWVDNKAVSERELTGRLCRRHANALTVPRGWTIDDRRDEIPRLFKVLAEEVAAQEAKPKKKAPRKAKEPALVEEVIPTLFDPDETQAIPWSPRLVASIETADDNLDDADGESTHVFGRLLGRAFGHKQTNEEE